MAFQSFGEDAIVLDVRWWLDGWVDLARGFSILYCGQDSYYVVSRVRLTLRPDADTVVILGIKAESLFARS